MKCRLLATAAALGAFALAVPAGAADLSTRPYAPAASYAPVAATNWTGFYVGANAGWGWGSGTFTNPNGALGGFQAGYNYQFANPIVVGVEADFDFSGMSAGGFSVDYIGTVRARLGYALDRFLVYGTGGFAYGDASANLWGLTSTKTVTGWTLGVGTEYAIDRNWSLRGEYLYTDLGSATYTSLAGPLSSDLNANILRAAVNYKF